MTKNEQSRTVRRPNLRATPLNKTTMFMLPAINFNKDDIGFKFLKYFGFVNCYLDHRQGLSYDDCLYLVFNPDKEAIRRFRDFYDRYRKYPNFVTDYCIDNNLIVVVFKVKDKWKETFKAFKNSKYSAMSKEYAEIFKRVDTVTGRTQRSREYHVIHKSKELREKMEEDLGVNISEDAELMDILNRDKEVFDYDWNTKGEEILALQASSV